MRGIVPAAPGTPVLPSGKAVSDVPVGHVVRSALDAALVEAEDEILAELDLVRRMLARAMDAARACDARTAEEVIAAREEALRRYERAHHELLSLIAQQQPAASDLRLAMALVHVNDRAERMAAQCVNVATLCSAVPEGERVDAEQLVCLTEMARRVDEQVAAARDAFAERDVVAAAGLREHDLQINDYNRRCFSLAVEVGTDEARRQAAFFAALMARALERIGDNAVDVGRQLAFVVTGSFR